MSGLGIFLSYGWNSQFLNLWLLQKKFGNSYSNRFLTLAWQTKLLCGNIIDLKFTSEKKLNKKPEELFTKLEDICTPVTQYATYWALCISNQKESVNILPYACKCV